MCDGSVAVGTNEVLKSAVKISFCFDPRGRMSKSFSNANLQCVAYTGGIKTGRQINLF